MIGLAIQRFLIALAGLVIATRVASFALPGGTPITAPTPGPVASATEPQSAMPSRSHGEPSAAPSPSAAAPSTTTAPEPSPGPSRGLVSPPPVRTPPAPTPGISLAPTPTPVVTPDTSTCPPGFEKVTDDRPLIDFCVHIPPLLVVCCRALD